MTRLRILICGGGCAGPALAYWLARSGHDITIIERAPNLRDTGAQIDLRAQGIEVIKRMGLLDTIRAKCVHELGMSMIDSNGKAKGTVMANTSGQGAQTFTSEFEIMRGDLVRVLYDATKDDENVRYIFGMELVDYVDDGEQVIVNFSDGSSDRFDLVVGADGQGSRLRKSILPEDVDPYRQMGVHMAYFFVPRIESDDSLARAYLCPGGRMIMRRSHNPTETQVYFMVRDGSPELSSLRQAPVEQQKEFWAQRFTDAGWETPRFLEGMKTAENFYSQEVLQVRIDKWHKDRVVLLGDAGYCPSPFTAMGTTASFIGAYVLAGEIARSPHDLPRALRGYEATLRPFVTEMQKMSTWAVRLALPDSQWAIKIFHFIIGVVCFLRLPEILARFASEDEGGWAVPEYPELNSSQ